MYRERTVKYFSLNSCYESWCTFDLFVHQFMSLCYFGISVKILFCLGEIHLGLKKPKASICFSCKENLRILGEQKRCVGKPVACVQRGRCCSVLTPFTQREIESKEVKRHGIAEPRTNCAGKSKDHLCFYYLYALSSA